MTRATNGSEESDQLTAVAVSPRMGPPLRTQKILYYLNLLVKVANYPKRKGKRSFPRRKYLRGNVDENLLLGTLATKTLISDRWDESPEDRVLLSSVVLSWTLDQLTNPQGPILFGVAHSDYTDAEVEAVIENAGSWAEGSKIEQEISKRLVRIIGTMVSTGESQSGPVDIQFNEGRKLKTKLNWVINQADGLRMWAYNLSATPLATTDPVLRANGYANLWVL